jgi:hypothetical protein
MASSMLLMTKILGPLALVNATFRQLGPLRILAGGFVGKCFVQGQPFALANLILLQGADALVRGANRIYPYLLQEEEAGGDKFRWSENSNGGLNYAKSGVVLFFQCAVAECPNWKLKRNSTLYLTQRRQIFTPVIEFGRPRVGVVRNVLRGFE